MWLRPEPEPWASGALSDALSDEAIAARLQAFLRDEEESDPEALAALRNALEDVHSSAATAAPKDEDGGYEPTPSAMRSLLRFQVNNIPHSLCALLISRSIDHSLCP